MGKLKTNRATFKQELAKLDELLVQQKMTAILGDCCSYEGENEYDIGGKTGRMNFLKVQMPQTKYPSVNMTQVYPDSHYS